MIEYNPETGDMRERKSEVKVKPKEEVKKEEKNELVAVDKLEVLVRDSGLEQTKSQVLLDKFTGYFQIASDWEKKAKAIVVTDAGQKAEMEMARVGRLFLREKRINIEKTRKELKEQSLREGKAIDGIANVLKAVIVPIEEYLGQQEKFVEIKAAEIAEQARIDMEEKAEKDRLAKEEADRKEQERIRVENEELKKEAEAKEWKLQKERVKAEAKELALIEKSRKEKLEAILESERKAQVEKERQEKILTEQKAEAEAKQKRAQEEAMKERKKAEIEQERIKAEAKQARKIQQAKLEAEKKEREKIQARLDEQIQCPFCHKKFNLKNTFERCIYCSSTDIYYNKDNNGLWGCNYCDESWGN